MIIGIIGGMGSYATLKIFEKFLNTFKAEKEWNRPRIIIDNNCTLPSRVVAYENESARRDVVEGLGYSIYNLINCGCTHIIIGCNTCHLFLEDVFKINPQFRKYVVSIVDVAKEYIVKNEIKSISVLCTEATRKSRLYESLEGVHVDYPLSDIDVRRYMECAKQNNSILEEYNLNKSLIGINKPILLGCTEFECYNYCDDLNIISPIDLVIQKLKDEYDTQKI